MNSVSIGDMALAFQNNRQNTQIKQNMLRLSQELASGQRTDLGSAVSGDFGPISSIEHALRTIGAYEATANEASLFVGSVQSTLERIQTGASSISNALLNAGTLTTAQLVDTASESAFIEFESTVSALNTRMGGRSLFAGRATDTAPLASSDQMLTDLQAAIALETTSAGVIAAVDAYFDDVGGGFETTGYLGSPNKMSDFRVADGENAKIDVKADDPEIRDVLKAMALGALVSQGALANDIEARGAILRESGERMIAADSKLAGVRASVGLVEGQIEDASVRNEAETMALEFARSDLLAIDPFETATELQATQTQLETLYTLTARMARLSLADYL
ncbi:MAG: flagellin [Paracoccaceae bacterium]